MTVLAFLDAADAADVDADRGVELERAAAGRRLGVAEHHADLLADLVDEDHGSVSLLATTPVSLRSAWVIRRACRPDVRVAHLAFDFRPRDQGGDGVDDDDVDGVGADEQLADLQRLLAGVGLGDEQVVER